MLRDLARASGFLSTVLFWVTFVVQPAGGAGIVVTSSASGINGDVSSPASLQAAPGPDGISLPEAVTAANNAAEPQAITFSGVLAGETIALTFPLVITRDGTTLTGLTSPEGDPMITVDGREAYQFNAVLYVLASDVIVRGLRFVGHQADGVSVQAGNNENATPRYPEQPRPRQQVRNVVIVGNIFGDNETEPGGEQGSAAKVYMAPEGHSVDASIEDVRISGNTFLRTGGDIGVNVAANGSNCLIRGVVIEDNSFTDLVTGGVFVESAQGSGNSIRGT